MKIDFKDNTRRALEVAKYGSVWTVLSAVLAFVWCCGVDIFFNTKD